MDIKFLGEILECIAQICICLCIGALIAKVERLARRIKRLEKERDNS